MATLAAVETGVGAGFGTGSAAGVGATGSFDASCVTLGFVTAGMGDNSGWAAAGIACEAGRAGESMNQITLPKMAMSASTSSAGSFEERGGGMKREHGKSSAGFPARR